MQVADLRLALVTEGVKPARAVAAGEAEVVEAEVDGAGFGAELVVHAGEGRGDVVGCARSSRLASIFHSEQGGDLPDHDLFWGAYCVLVDAVAEFWWEGEEGR